MGIPKWFTGAVNGAINGSGLKGMPKVMQSCSELNWDTTRVSEKTISIAFNTPIGDRLLTITSDDDSNTAIMIAYSAYRVHYRSFDTDIAAFLVSQNLSFGGWQMRNDDGTLHFIAHYSALTLGLDSVVLKAIAEDMVSSVCQFDKKFNR